MKRKKFYLTQLMIFTLTAWNYTLTYGQTPDINGIVYVKPAATGDGSGNSWLNATDNLQGAIDATGAQKVFVSIGLYNITSYTTMKNNVAIYGGFDPDNGIDDLSENRILPNLGTNEGSVLDGGNTITPIRNYQNGLNNTAVLDGFTIKNGKDAFGGGIYSNGVSSVYRNIVLKENTANNSGGAIYNENASVTLTNVIIENNTAQYGGGAQNVNSNALFQNVIFRNNSATMATIGAGGGAIFNQNSNAIFTNVLMENNTTQFQGGAFVSVSGVPVLTNVTVANNTADINFSSFDIRNDSVIVNNSIVFGINNGLISSNYSFIEGNINTSNGNLNATGISINDVFTDVANDDYSLALSSVALNTGSNTLFTGLNSSSKDLAGKKRKAGQSIDLGAYEYQSFPSASGVSYVKPIATGTGLGNDWANAGGDIQEAINTTNTQKVFVAVGNYPLPISSIIMKNNVAVYGGFDSDNGIDDLSDNRILPTELVSGSVLDGLNIRPLIWNDNNGLDSSAILDGFTLMNGYSNNHGGAIFNNVTAPSFANLVIKNNTAANSGGGIYNANSPIKLRNAIITNNTAKYGGGFRNNNSASIFINVIIKNNAATMTTTGAGGGAIFNQGSGLKLTNALIYGNTTGFQGGAVVNLSGVPIFTNVTIANNTADIDFSALDIRNDSVILNNAIVFGEISGTTFPNYSFIEGHSNTNNGNVDATGVNLNDVFVGVSTDDFTLKATSPAINSGSNILFSNVTSSNIDLAGNPRFNGVSIDMGAFEYDITAGIKEISGNELVVYPNPAHSILMIDVAESMDIEIVSVLGEVILSKKLNPGANSISVDNFTSGIYFIKSNLGASVKIVKE